MIKKFIFTLLAISILFYISINTDYVKETLHSYLEDKLSEKMGENVSLGTIESLGFATIALKNPQFGSQFTAKRLSISFSWTGLLFNEWIFENIEIDSPTFGNGGNKDSLDMSAPEMKNQISITVRHFIVRSLKLPQFDQICKIEGEGSWKNALFLEAKLRIPGSAEKIDLFVQGTPQLVSTMIHLDGFEKRYAFGNTRIRAQGPLESWKACLFQEKGEFSPLTGNIQSQHSKTLHNFSAQLSISAQREIRLNEILAEFQSTKVTGNLTVSPLQMIEEGHFEIVYQPANFGGELLGDCEVSGPLLSPYFKANISSLTSLEIQKQTLSDMKGTIEGRACKTGLTGTCAFNGSLTGSEAHLSLDLAWKYHDSIELSKLHASTLESEFSSQEMLYSLQNKTSKGDLSFHISDLNKWSRWSKTPLGGSLKGSLEVFPSQNAQVSLEAKNLLIGDLRAEEFNIQGRVIDEIPLQINAKNLRFRKVHLAELSAQTLFEDNVWRFRIETPETLKIAGIWQGYGVLIEQFDAISDGTAIQLQNPWSIRWLTNNATFLKSTWKVGQGSISFEKEHEIAFINLDQAPINLLNPLEFMPPIQGLASGHIQLSEEGKWCLAEANLDIKDCVFSELEHVDIHANISAKKNGLTFSGKVLDHTTGAFTFSGTLPSHFSLNRFSSTFDSNAALLLKMDGLLNLTPLVKFFTTLPHSTRGVLHSQFVASGSYSKPKLQGHVQITDAQIEDSTTGALISDLKVELEGVGKKIKLINLKGKSGKDGLIEASGDLTIGDELSFTSHITVTNAPLLQVDNAEARFDGDLNINKVGQELAITGELQCLEAKLIIPDQLVSKIPEMNVIYSHPLNANSLEPLPEKVNVNVNVKITTTDKVSLAGHGLLSEWKGAATVTNSNKDLAVHGVFNLLRGDFTFSGKTFTLSKGVLTFSGNPGRDNYLKIIAQTSVDTVVIDAIINGPLNHPELSFRSNPQLPQEEIFAHLLFNKSTAQMSPLQVIQVAQTMANLSGVTPDFIGQLRRGLGLDLLEVNTSSEVNRESTDDDDENMGIQIGKYLTDRIYISVRKGLTLDVDEFVLEAKLLKEVKAKAAVDTNSDTSFQIRWSHDY